jgi:hypothetical protein
MNLIRLSRAAGEFLIRLVEQEPPVALQSTLDEFAGDVGRELIAAGALIADGSTRSVTLFDEDPPRNVDLIWLDQQRAYGYFSATDGFVIPDQNSLQLYRVDFGWWLRWLTAALDLVNAGKPTVVIADACWIVGDVWVTSRTKVPLVFARRLKSRSIALAVAASLNHRPAENGGIVLTTSRQPSAVRWPDRFEVKWIQSLLNSDGKDFVINNAQLVARWTLPGVSEPSNPLSLSPDGRVLMLHGQALHLRGPVHRSIIRKLFNAHVDGKPARTQDVLSEAAPTVDTIAKAFRNSPHWVVLKPRIRTKNGLSWFEL